MAKSTEPITEEQALLITGDRATLEKLVREARARQALAKQVGLSHLYLMLTDTCAELCVGVEDQSKYFLYGNKQNVQAQLTALRPQPQPTADNRAEV